MDCDECERKIKRNDKYYRIYECKDERNWLGHLLAIHRNEIRTLCRRCSMEGGII